MQEIFFTPALVKPENIENLVDEASVDLIIYIKKVPLCCILIGRCCMGLETRVIKISKNSCYPVNLYRGPLLVRFLELKNSANTKSISFGCFNFGKEIRNFSDSFFIPDLFLHCNFFTNLIYSVIINEITVVITLVIKYVKVAEFQKNSRHKKGPTETCLTAN